MPRRFVVISSVFLLVLVLTLPVAAKTIKSSFLVAETVTLAGTELEPGKYRLVADESSVAVFQGGKKVLETEATWVDGEKPDRTSVLTREGKIREIHIAGKERYLKFGE